MKIILEHDENNRVVIDTDEEVIYEVMDKIESALIAFGFHPNVVRDGFLAKTEEYEVED